MQNNPPPLPAYQEPTYIQPQNGTHVVVTTQPGVIAQTLRESPVRMTCPQCRNDILTSIHYQTGTITWVACIVLCVIGCSLGCCFIPFCLDQCKDVIHTCPSCRYTIGRYSKI